MSDDQQIEPWNEPPPTETDLARRRAASWVWAIAAVEFLFAGCCAAALLAYAATPPSELERTLSQRGFDEQQIVILIEGQADGKALAVRSCLLGTLPALMLGLTAFGVLRGRRWAIILCLVVVLMQLIVAGAFLLMVVAVSLSSGQPAQFTLGLIVLGSFIAVLAFTFKHLLTARQPAADDASPWIDP